MNLNKGTGLQQGKYVIEKELGKGGFGITYLAEQVSLHRKVAIKEFFMSSYCSRDEETTGVQVSKGIGKETFDVYLKKFVKEAQTIASLDSPHIIRIFDIFEENNTAYYVMDYLPGGTLTERIPEGGMDAEQARKYIRQVAVALDYLHQCDIMHLDVKPGNILFKRDAHNRDTAILIDFGLAKHYDKESKDQTTGTPIGISEGYAPLEQYETDGVKTFQPSTDIYALGATLYHLLVGKRPSAASLLLKGLPPFQKPLPDYIIRTVQKAMMSSKEDRPQSVAEFLKYLDGADVVEEEDTDLTLTPDAVDAGKAEEFIKEEAKENPAGLVNYGGPVLQEMSDKPEDSKPAGDSGSVIKHLDVSGETPTKDTPAWMRFLTGKGDRPLKYTAFGVASLLILFFIIGVIITVVEIINNDKKNIGKDMPTKEIKSDIPVIVTDSTAVSFTDSIQEESVWTNKVTAEAGAPSPVDLGLSVKWASAAMDGYFAWGHTAEGDYTIEKMKKDLKEITGNKEYDAATNRWGEGWRLPTKDEVQELIDNCKWAWTNQNGRDGYLVTGKNDNSIFLPANGYIMEKGTKMFVGERGYYQTGDGDSDNNQFCWVLFFDGRNIELWPSNRSQGNSIWAVRQ